MRSREGLMGLSDETVSGGRVVSEVDDLLLGGGGGVRRGRVRGRVCRPDAELVR